MQHYFKDYTHRPAIYVSSWDSFHHITASVQQASLVHRPQQSKVNSKVNTERMLNIVKSYNVFSPLHCTAIFETLKFSLLSFFLRFHSVIAIWNKKELPEEWKESIIVPIHKKGEKKQTVIIIGA
jgi:hypothetical protein